MTTLTLAGGKLDNQYGKMDQADLIINRQVDGIDFRSLSEQFETLSNMTTTKRKTKDQRAKKVCQC